MADENRIKQWLTSSNYRTPQITLRDILNVTTHYQGLHAQQERYTFVDGTPRDLVCLKGTIPVTYKGSVYNIPICIWLMDTHPANAPICYVRPTADMSIKVSMFVDQNGKIYLPYLHDWVPNASDIIGLIQVMIVTFGEHSPVFSRPRDNEMQYPSYMPQNPYMPFPQPYGGGSSGSYPSPYPASNTGMPQYPPYPSQFPSYPTPSFGSPPAIPNNTGTIKEEHIRQSLLSGIEDKLKRRMKELLLQSQAELETLRRIQDDLTQGKGKLDSILSRMEKEENDLNKNITLLQDKEQELDKAIERLSNQEPMDVDDAVITTAPLYKQLLNVFAEEAALEDAIYYMGEALRCGVIDLDVFLRQVRSLSRKQFMLRALMQKCRQKAGLAL